MSARVRVGIASWADQALIESGAFYPRRSMSAQARLRWYARFFDTVEVNASYYAIPDVRHVARWVERTPPGFLFNVKAYAPMTGHAARPQTLPADVLRLLPDAASRNHRDEVEADAFPPAALDETFRLFRASLAPLAAAGKLGYVLFQLAPWVRFGPERLAYVASLPERLPGWTVAVEFRHRSWLPERADETLDTLRAAGVANVVVDGPAIEAAIPRVPVVTARTAVVRLHGRNAEGWLKQVRGEAPAVRVKYDYRYGEGELAALLPEIERLAEESEQVVISFNNNNRDYPVQNALMLRRMLGQPARAPAQQQSLPRDLLA
ncbi:MAG: DUF72 domain-containing protein [Candidatus Rokubacteria bacterium]|nr:DUF72 domain-containing protein [Candidatus Rokubacteria bacterium]MBI3825810.1 DUF72 domain-containing protein [Candidatus Rokubacteria bacterium]